MANGKTSTSKKSKDQTTSKDQTNSNEIKQNKEKDVKDNDNTAKGSEGINDNNQDMNKEEQNDEQTTIEEENGSKPGNDNSDLLEKEGQKGNNSTGNIIDSMSEKDRRKLLQSLHPNKRQLRMWDPELIAMKQRALMSQVYGEQLEAPFWHPNMLRQQRPYWAKLAPSSAALSYNFAIDQYHPLMAKKGTIPSPFLDEKGHPREFLWQAIDDEELQVGSSAGSQRKRVN